MDDCSVNKSRVVAAEAYLGQLHPRLATSIEAAEEQTFEDFAKHSDQCDRSNIVCIFWSSVVFYNQTDHSVVPSTRGLPVPDAGVVQCRKDVDE